MPVGGFASHTCLWFGGVLFIQFAHLGVCSAPLSVVWWGAILAICLSVV